MYTSTLSLLTMLMLSGPSAVTDTSRSLDDAFISHCLVSLIDDVQVPAQEAGALVSVLVDEGSLVQEGALLGQIDDRQGQLQKLAAQMERDAALARANDDIEVQYAKASLAVAEAELAQNEEVNRRSPGSITATELRRLRLTKRRTELQIDKSWLDMKVAKMTADVQESAVKLAEENIRRRRILAPLDGIVMTVYRQTGEWVNAGEPVLRVVRMDRLRVEGFVNAAEYNPSEIDSRPVTVEIELARGRRVQFSGQVVLVNPQLQAGNKYRIRAEVENRLDNQHWLLRPGMAAAMSIHLR